MTAMQTKFINFFVAQDTYLPYNNYNNNVSMLRVLAFFSAYVI
jgi:hypothetical protein